MPNVYEKTITVKGIEKNVNRFADSLNYAKYKLDNKDKTLDFLKTVKTEDTVKIYLYFDDGVVGNISDIEILDNEDEVIIKIDDYFTKESHKGFYILFRYRFVEEAE